VNRIELQQLAEDRLLDAQALLAAGRWSGAYYLAGYAVECGLKACVFVRILNEGVIFEEKKFASSCWTHEIKELVPLAALSDVRGPDVAAYPILRKNWETAEKWSEVSRYQQKTQGDAEELYNAIADSANGVMQWIRARW
jgi:hypothetical protein